MRPEVHDVKERVGAVEQEMRKKKRKRRKRLKFFLCSSSASHSLSVSLDALTNWYSPKRKREEKEEKVGFKKEVSTSLSLLTRLLVQLDASSHYYLLDCALWHQAVSGTTSSGEPQALSFLINIISTLSFRDRVSSDYRSETV